MGTRFAMLFVALSLARPAIAHFSVDEPPAGTVLTEGDLVRVDIAVFVEHGATETFSIAAKNGTDVAPIATGLRESDFPFLFEMPEITPGSGSIEVFQHGDGGYIYQQSLAVVFASASVTDAGEADSGSSPSDAGMDAGDTPMDAGSLDAGSLDAGPVDAGSVDAGSVDAGSVDAGSVDAGSVDAGSVDAGQVDAGQVDAGQVDAGQVDAGTDAGVTDAGEPSMDAGDGTTDDSGSQPVDAGEAQVDAGSGNGHHDDADAGHHHHGEDAGPHEHDAGAADAGETPQLDAGASAEGDAGVSADAGDSLDAGGSIFDAGDDAQSDAGPESDAGGSDAGGFASVAELQTFVLRTCATNGCHSGAMPRANLDLTESGFAEELVGVQAARSQGVRVDPCLPAESVLLQRLEGTLSLRMPPPPEDPLTEAQLDSVRAWIASGAPLSGPIHADSPTECTAIDTQDAGMGNTVVEEGWGCQSISGGALSLLGMLFAVARRRRSFDIVN